MGLSSCTNRSSSSHMRATHLGSLDPTRETRRNALMSRRRGRRTTIVIEFWNDRDQVEAVLRANKVINPGGLYRLYDPLEEGKIRRGLIIGGEE